MRIWLRTFIKHDIFVNSFGIPLISYTANGSGLGDKRNICDFFADRNNLFNNFPNPVLKMAKMSRLTLIARYGFSVPPAARRSVNA